jgi:hypothetical protein
LNLIFSILFLSAPKADFDAVSIVLMSAIGNSPPYVPKEKTFISFAASPCVETY